MKKFGIILFGLSMLLAQPLAGQDAPRPLNDTERVGFIGAPGTYSGFGTRFGPYTGKLLTWVGSDPTWASMSMVCVDYGNYVWPGADWNVNVTNVGLATADGDMANTRAGATSGSLLKYQKAAYLASMFTSGPSTQTAWADLHWAIWTIMSPTAFAPYGSSYVPGTNWVQALATYGVNDSRFGGFDFTQWSVISDQRMGRSAGIGVNGFQEQLVRNPVVTPEPETYVLLVSGLFFMVLVGRRRFKEMGYF